MKQKLTQVGGRVLLVLLITGMLAIFASTGVTAVTAANPVRSLPATVSPGQQFNVTVTFTSPVANFNSIGLHDAAPGGWTVSVNTGWNSPAADADNTPNPGQIEYIWYGPYASGVTFTVKYTIQVPADAAPGTYNFPGGFLAYYIGASGPTVEPIAGKSQIEVVQSARITGLTKEVKCAIQAGVTITVYQGAVVKASTISDGSGNYVLTLPALGAYNVTVSKAGFRSQTQAISVTQSTDYTLNFQGDHGLIPNAPDMPYVLACVNLWKFGSAPCQLTMLKVLAVINAWKNPIT
jgi:hypothetical protein